MVLILSHNKNAHGHGGKLVLHALEKIVIPGKHDIRRSKFERVIAEFDVADAAPEAGVPANLHQQALAFAGLVRSAVRLDSHVIPQCAGQKNVVPAADVKSRDLNVRKMLLDGPLLPIPVVVGMREPIKIIRSQLGRGVGARWKRGVIEGRIVSERKHGCAQQRVCVFRDPSPHRVRGELRRPILIEPLFKRSALICPAVVIIAGRDHRADSREVRRMGNRGEHLCRADVGTSHHADFAVRGWQRSSPFDGVVAVVGLMTKRIPVPFRRVTPTNILHDDDIAVRGNLIGRRGRPAHAFIVGRAHQDDRKFPVRLRTVNVRIECDAVTRFHRDAILRDHRIALLCTNAMRRG